VRDAISTASFDETAPSSSRSKARSRRGCRRDASRASSACAGGSKRELGEDVAAHLRDRRTLLVLDNFEAPQRTRGRRAPARGGARRADDRHVARPPRDRERMAAAHRRASISRGGGPRPHRGVRRVRLFVQAARRVEPALVPSVEAAAIVDICRQVEGMPLALEVAASWTRVLSCDAIAGSFAEAPSSCSRSIPRGPPATRAWRSCSTSRGGS
jgi:predicted ATPase